jgi:hypothetical protein
LALKTGHSAGRGHIVVDDGTLVIGGAVPVTGISNDFLLAQDALLEASLVVRLRDALSIASQANVSFNSAPPPPPPTGPVHNATSGSSPTFIMDLTSFSSDDDTYNIAITGSTVKSSLTNETAFETFLSDAATITLNDGSVLDLTGQNGVTLHNFSGTGKLLNTGAHETLTIATTPYPQFFVGTVRGDFDLTVTGFDSFTGSRFGMKAGDTIHMSGNSTLLELNGVTFVGAEPAIDMTTGSNEHLAIDHNYAGTISNFGNNDGIIIGDETYDSKIVIHYDHNAQNTGGVLRVQIGSQAEIDLTLAGHYTWGNFHVVSAIGGPMIVSSAAIAAADHLTSADLAAIHDTLI